LRLLVIVEQSCAGIGDSGPGSLSRELTDDVAGHAHIVGVSEIVLQPLQPFDKSFYLGHNEEALEQLDRVSEFFGGDAQLVPLTGTLLAKPFAAPAQLSPASIEQARRQLADRNRQHRRRRPYFTAPAMGFEPM